MSRAGMLESTESIFKRAGFQVSERCVARPSCFDFAARGHEQPVFVKVPKDVGSVSAEDALELRTISGCFSATPLFVCDKTRRKTLEDDTVYMRYNIYSITSKTLEDTVFREMHPLFEAGPGGCYVNIDGNAVREKRQKLGLSVGKLAEMIGISRRTLYGYEKGMAKASVSAAYNLEWVLGVPVVKPVNVFRDSPSDVGFFSTAKHVIKDRFLQMVLRGFGKFNVKVTPTKKAPFDFIARCSGGQFCVLGGVSDKMDKNLDQRTGEIISVGEVIDAQSVFITNGEQIPNSSIPLIYHEELARMKGPEELIARL